MDSKQSASVVAKQCLKVACLGVGIATAYGAGASTASASAVAQSTTVVNYTIDPTQTISDGYFFFYTNTSSSSVQVTYSPFSDLAGPVSLAANTSNTGSVTFSDLGTSSLIGGFLGFIGVYTNASNNTGISTLFSNSTNIINSGDSFDTAFANSATATESTLVSDLQGANTSALANFFNGVPTSSVAVSDGFGVQLTSAPPVSLSGDLVNFSSPTNGGTLSAQVVPEPAAVGLFAGGLLALLLMPLRLLRKR